MEPGYLHEDDFDDANFCKKGKNYIRKESEQEITNPPQVDSIDRKISIDRYRFLSR